MTLHRKHQRYTAAHARRKLASAEATLAHWMALTPKHWRQHADKHQALQVWSAQVRRWRAIVDPPREVDRFYTLPF